MKKSKNILIVLLLVLNVFITACSNFSTEDISEANNTEKSTVDLEFNIGNEKVLLQHKKILNDRIEILIPKSFNLMSEEMAKFKYPYERRPKLVYTNDTGSVNIAFNYTQSKVTNNQIKEYKDFFKETLSKLHPSAKWYRDYLIQVDNRDIGVLELLTPALDTKVYNLMFFTDLDGKLLMMTFNCTEKEMKDWKPVAECIMNSLKLK
ncbi:hypothetical protein [Sporosalibacterium faouarense]|uniref:hypothetical protein n=1 Tax=Sporosalibacterium faouarense TaxID=516123 RepID=UPI00192A6E28|nr:hypothetical protein [Sporosalibacterium faouarense]